MWCSELSKRITITELPTYENDKTIHPLSPGLERHIEEYSKAIMFTIHEVLVKYPKQITAFAL